MTFLVRTAVLLIQTHGFQFPIQFYAVVHEKGFGSSTNQFASTWNSSSPHLLIQNSILQDDVLRENVLREIKFWSEGRTSCKFDYSKTPILT